MFAGGDFYKNSCGMLLSAFLWILLYISIVLWCMYPRNVR